MTKMDVVFTVCEIVARPVLIVLTIVSSVVMI